jgi:hypothetical protein
MNNVILYIILTTWVVIYFGSIDWRRKYSSYKHETYFTCFAEISFITLILCRVYFAENKFIVTYMYKSKEFEYSDVEDVSLKNRLYYSKLIINFKEPKNKLNNLVLFTSNNSSKLIRNCFWKYI